MATQLAPANVLQLAPELPRAAERRAATRFTSQRVKLTFLGIDHIAHNWSTAGALVNDHHPNLDMGSTVAGVVTVRGCDGFFRFAAEVVRQDTRTKELALRFLDCSPALAAVLAGISH